MSENLQRDPARSIADGGIDEDEPENEQEDEHYREAARNLYHSVEIDGDALVSHGDDDGAYVQGWVWVSGDDMRSQKERSET